MNMDIFYQLEKEAIEYARSVCNSAGNYVVDSNGKEVIFFTFHEVIRQKLAELIVKHCIIELERCTLRNGNSEHNLALYEAMSRIRHKFGVELK